MKVLNKIRKTVLVIISTMAAAYILLWFRWVSMGMINIDQMINRGIIACVCSIWLLAFTIANIGEENEIDI